MFVRVFPAKIPVIRILLITGIFICTAPSLTAQYLFNDRCREAYQAVFTLHFQQATRLLEEERATNPANLLPHYLENYIDFLIVYLGEDQAELERLLPNKTRRIKALEKGDPSQPFYRYCLAEIYMQWAFVRLKFGDFTQAALDVRKAGTLLSENEAIFPGFLPDNTPLGIIHLLTGMIPDNLTWISKILGFKGSIGQGMAELRSVVSYTGPDPVINLLRPEAAFYLALIAGNLQKNHTEALTLIDQLAESAQNAQFNESPLIVFAKANIYMRNGMNDRALNVLSSRKTDREAYPFYYLDYLEGLARLHRMDPDAGLFFQRYLARFRGRNCVGATLQKLAWIDFLNGDTAGYLRRMDRLKKIPSPLIDEDKQAIQEARSGMLPSRILLKARLLFDGGYYDRALDEMNGHPVRSYLKTSRDLIEYTYRLGRIFQEKKEFDKAIGYYRQTIQRGKAEPYYFACASALQMGLMYEALRNNTLADSAFRLCLTIPTPEYKASLSQKARAGLNRLRKK